MVVIDLENSCVAKLLVDEIDSRFVVVVRFFHDDRVSLRLVNQIQSSIFVGVFRSGVLKSKSLASLGEIFLVDF